MSGNQDILVEQAPVWSNFQNYYAHIAKLWDDVRLARQRINDAPGNDILGGFKALEDWLEAQKSLTDKLAPYLDPLVLEKIDERYAEIDRVTNGLQFAFLAQNAVPQTWKTIKERLYQNERQLNIEQGKLGLFMMRKVKEDKDLYLA
jgi:hypothetical protein